MNPRHGAPCRRRGAVSRDVPAPKLNLDTGLHGRLERRGRRQPRHAPDRAGAISDGAEVCPALLPAMSVGSSAVARSIKALCGREARWGHRGGARTALPARAGTHLPEATAKRLTMISGTTRHHRRPTATCSSRCCRWTLCGRRPGCMPSARPGSLYRLPRKRADAKDYRPRASQQQNGARQQPTCLRRAGLAWQPAAASGSACWEKTY